MLSSRNVDLSVCCDDFANLAFRFFILYDLQMLQYMENVIL